jgi:putative peptidoglycan lipid II flippase
MSEAKNHPSTKKHALIATAAIFFSRIFGLVREQFFAFFFGASAVLDAFIVAFRIPNLLRDLFAEGALSQSFVTIFSQKLATEDQKQAYTLAHKVSGFILLSVGFLVILGEIFAPQLVGVLASGFTGEKLELTIRLTRILMPFILFVSLSALLMGMLNAQHKFFIPQSASTFFNITSVSVGLGFAYILSPDYIGGSLTKIMGGDAMTITDGLALANAITGMALGTLIGGVGQLLFQLPALARLKYLPKFNFNFKDPALIKVLKLTGPAIIGGAAVQVNVLVNTYFASYLSHGSISYLNYSFRLMQFPLGVFGVAIAVASAPALAKMIAKKDTKSFVKTIQSSIQMSLFLSIPSAVGLIVLSDPIISLIYEHGHFSHADTLQTSYALMAYAFGISAYSLIKIYQPAYLAFHDAKTPMMVSLASILVNFSINWYFIRILNWPHWALALGTAIVACLNFTILMWWFHKKQPGIWTMKLFVNFLKILISAVVMGVGLWYFRHNYWDAVCAARFDSKILSQLIQVFAPLFLGVIIYFMMAILLKVDDVKVFTRRFTKK